jgi:hypothetical protein
MSISCVIPVHVTTACVACAAVDISCMARAPAAEPEGTTALLTEIRDMLRLLALHHYPQLAEHPVFSDSRDRPPPGGAAAFKYPNEASAKNAKRPAKGPPRAEAVPTAPAARLRNPGPGSSRLPTTGDIPDTDEGDGDSQD